MSAITSEGGSTVRRSSRLKDRAMRSASNSPKSSPYTSPSHSEKKNKINEDDVEYINILNEKGRDRINQLLNIADEEDSEFESLPDIVFNITNLATSEFEISKDLKSRDNILVRKLPSRLLQIFSNLRMCDTSLENRAEFTKFFESERKEWVSSAFYQDIASIMWEMASFGNESIKRLIPIAASNSICVKDCGETVLDRECDGCGKVHNILSYQVEVLDSDGSVLVKLYMGKACGKIIEKISEVYHVLNSITHLPKNNMVMIACFSLIDALKSECRDMIFRNIIIDEIRV